MQITVINGTIRRGNQSQKVSRYLVHEINQRPDLEGHLLDLGELNLPMLWERSHYMSDEERPAALVKYCEAVKSSDALIVVCPEYNGGYPAAFKNAFDALYSEYNRKPFGLVSVSAGYGGYTVITQLRELVSRVRGLIVPTTFMARNVGSAFDEEGTPANEFITKGANGLISEVVWYAAAVQGQVASEALKQ